MDKRNFDISILVGKYMADHLSEEEADQLEGWLSESERHRVWFSKVTAESYRRKKLDSARGIDVERGWITLLVRRSARDRRRLGMKWCKYAALFLSPLLIAFVLYQQFHASDGGVKSGLPITAGTSRAFLVMADGVSVALEQQAKQVLEEQDGTKIDLREKTVVYENAGEVGGGELLYNELVVPRGGEFSLTLSDGTVVYLNADSRLRFPVKFGVSERVVELEGEAYFEVTRNENAPFIVKTPALDLTVLGTEFNVSAYQEDSLVRATLVQGSIRVSLKNGGISEVLQPGEQAEYNQVDHLFRVDSVHVSYAMAWKDGRLSFRGKPLHEIMKTIARWYDVEVVYEDEEVKNYPFGCNFSRHATIEPLLEVFEGTGTVDIRVEGRKIWIKKLK